MKINKIYHNGYSLQEELIDTNNLGKSQLYVDVPIGAGIVSCCGGTIDDDTTINKTVMGIQLGFNLDKSKLLDPEAAKKMTFTAFDKYGQGVLKYRDKCARFFRYIFFNLGDVEVTMKVSSLTGNENGQA